MKGNGRDKEGQARLNPACVVCGAQNPNGLRIRFAGDTNGVWANWLPTEGWESFQGVIHGGIITAVLDEAMSKAIISRDWQALTAELTVRFRDRVSPGETLQVRGWIKDRRRRRIRTEAILTTEHGQELAHAWATFLTAPHTGPPGLSGRH
jgi:Thioesterase superfamily